MEFSSPSIRWTKYGAMGAIAISATVLSATPGWTVEASPEQSTPEPIQRSHLTSRPNPSPPIPFDQDATLAAKPMTVSLEKPSPVPLPWSVSASETAIPLPDGASDQWTVPLGGGGGRVFTIGSQPVNASLQAYWNAIKPEGAADWTVRAQLTLLFP